MMDLPKLLPGRRVALHWPFGEEHLAIHDWAWRRSLTLILLPPDEPLDVKGLDVHGILTPQGYQELGPAKETRHLAFEVRTSGTTGKGTWVPIEREMVMSHVDGACERLGHTFRSRWVCCLPLHHVGGVMILHRILQRGGDLQFVAPNDTEGIATALETATHISMVPRQFLRLRHLVDRSPAQLVCVLIGGDRMEPALALEALASGWPLYLSYGMTETTSQCCTATPEEVQRNPAAVGRPIKGVQIRLQDGRIQVVGPTVLGHEFLTEDLGRIVDGQLVVEGRLHHRIVVNGETLDARALEASLEALPGVISACVVGVPDPERGQVPVCAYEGTAEPEHLLLALTGVQRLAKAVRMELPRTDLGKVRRQDVLDRLQA